MTNRPAESDCDGIQSIHENRDALEAIADTTLPASDWAAHLLELANELEGTHGDDMP